MAGQSTPKKSASTKKNGLKKMTDQMWVEMKTLYEGGNYSQQQLSDWAKAKGYSCHQATVARHVEYESWIKGSILEAVREEILREHREAMGETLVDMLQRHNQMTQMAMSETLRHFKHAAEKRKLDPEYDIPAAQIATLTTTLKIQQDMQARALGWDYKEGKPFAGDDDDKNEDIPELIVRVMSEDEEAVIRQRGQDNLDEMVEG